MSAEKSKGSSSAGQIVLSEFQRAGLYFWQNQKPLLALLVMAIAFAFLTEHFFTLPNIINVARQTSIYALLAAGMTLVLTLSLIHISEPTRPY